MALAVVLPAAQLVSPACCERPSTLYPQLFTVVVVLVALHWLADMEGNANRYDTNEVSDDEEEDFMDSSHRTNLCMLLTRITSVAIPAAQLDSLYNNTNSSLSHAPRNHPTRVSRRRHSSSSSSSSHHQRRPLTSTQMCVSP